MHSHTHTHLLCTPQELDAIAGVPGTVLCFMEGVACCASVMLQTLNIHTDKLQQYMVEAENKFSCQVCVMDCGA